MYHTVTTLHEWTNPTLSYSYEITQIDITYYIIDIYIYI